MKTTDYLARLSAAEISVQFSAPACSSSSSMAAQSHSATASLYTKPNIFFSKKKFPPDVRLRHARCLHLVLHRLELQDGAGYDDGGGGEGPVHCVARPGLVVARAAHLPQQCTAQFRTVLPTLISVMLWATSAAAKSAGVSAMSRTCTQSTV